MNKTNKFNNELNSQGKHKTVLLVVTVATTVEKFLAGYASYLERNGFRVVVVSSDVSSFESQFSIKNIECHSVPMARNPSPIKDFVSLVRMIFLLVELKPDAVIFATPKASLITSIASKICAVPVRIYSLWGIRFETKTGFSRIILKVLEQITVFSSTAVLANSQSLAEAAANLGILKKVSVTVLGRGSSHGVDTKVFSENAEMPRIDINTETFIDKNPGPTIGFIGRIHPDKGIDTLISALQLLHSKDSAFKAIIVGGDEGYLDFAKKMSSGLPIHFAGEIEDVRPYLVNFDLLVLMSLREGFPNVVLEAASMCVPSIVSDATGCVDSVVTGETGFVVETGNVAKLVEKLEMLIDSEMLRVTLGRNARNYVLNNFTQEWVWEENKQFLVRQFDKITH